MTQNANRRGHEFWTAAAASLVDGIGIGSDIFHDGDLRRTFAHARLMELYAVYIFDGIRPSESYSEGIVNGVDLAMKVIVRHSYDETVRLVNEVLDERLASTGAVEAIFYQGNGNPADVMLDQIGNEVGSGLAFVLGFRRGLKYALKLVLAAEANEQHPHPFAGGRIKAEDNWAAVEADFVANELPRLREAHVDRPMYYEVDLINRGWSRSDDVIRSVTGLLYNAEAAEELMVMTGDADIRKRLVEKIREDEVKFQTFLLGHGNFDCRPSANNQVFDRAVPADQVSVNDVQEVIRLFIQAGNKSVMSSKNWLAAA